jgi:predicted ribosome quality control (RQC) complex YloA/Tae2 family protein
VRAEGTPEAEAIKEIREKDARIVLELEGKEVEIDIRLSVEENAAKYYEDSKWARKKLGKLEEAKEGVRKKAEEAAPPVPEKEKPKRRPRKRWYEKYKWFTSTDGFLVVAGRDAKQNDTLLTKYAEQADWVYHADIPGAAFVVIRGEGKEVPEQTKKEAADFAAANSKAWSRGLGTVDVFCAPRSRVSKPGGMPRGSWVYSGEREWFRKLELKLSVGVKIEGEKSRVICGPVMAVRNRSDYFVTIKPGGRQSLDLARVIKNKILIKAKPEDKPWIEGIDVTEFEKAVPGGTGDIVEYT